MACAMVDSFRMPFSGRIPSPIEPCYKVFLLGGNATYRDRMKIRFTNMPHLRHDVNAVYVLHQVCNVTHKSLI